MCSLRLSCDTLKTTLEGTLEEEMNSEFLKVKLSDEFHRKTKNPYSLYENTPK